MTMNWVSLCHLDDLDADGMYPFVIGEKKIAIYLISGAVYATDNICSHAYTLLTDGWLEDGLVECPLHGAQFDIRTGQVVRGPADCPIAVFETRIRENVVEVLIEGTV
ncbi:(2Fe-2S)-binding protein [Mesorhizobium sp. SARCC-RB16n]|uniref:non-heme iron oxygenase ferredoxin subunit n=1 Tax=Mesorhizobium sp. SARCC-RB16n TaxID=2116687 RepID=UPI00122EE11F|nr:non-heme iron oxygenase ferredoxin subunit [Mesorhizobium sp. SARCC-RB16n]KAA3445831.1 (2Fe-2S)-binding protein [Mesorhizobium sp. SARCC-RB16n]